jgi:hypothetical protein
MILSQIFSVFLRLQRTPVDAFSVPGLWGDLTRPHILGVRRRHVHGDSRTQVLEIFVFATKSVLAIEFHHDADFAAHVDINALFILRRH